MQAFGVFSLFTRPPLTLRRQLLGSAAALGQRRAGFDLGALSGIQRALGGQPRGLTSRQFAFQPRSRHTQLGQARLGTSQPLSDTGLLAFQLVAAQIKLLQAALELLASAGQRSLTLIADSQLALDCFGAGV